MASTANRQGRRAQRAPARILLGLLMLPLSAAAAAAQAPADPGPSGAAAAQAPAGHGQPGAVSAEPEPVAPAPEDRPRPTSARYLDASADRALLTSTAETHPEGTLYVTTYYLLPQLGYAVTDRLQLSVAGIGGPDGGFLDVSLKANLLRRRHIRVSATAAIDYARGTDLDLLFGRARGTLQWCATGDCHSSISATGMMVLHAFPGVALPYGIGASAVTRLVEGVSVLLDFASVHNASRDLFFLDFPFYFVSYGLRLSAGPSWALDIGMIRSLTSGTPTVPAARTLQDTLGFPFFAFSYRIGSRIHPY